MPSTGEGGQFGGPQYGWGGVPNDPSAGARSGSAGSRTNFNSGLNDGRYTAGPEVGMRRGAWQWSGHGPSAQRDYGWDYQGGVGRDEITMRSEARDGGSYLSHMAQDRGGGLPRYSEDYDAGDRWFPRLGHRAGGRSAQDYDRGMRGGMGGGYDRGYQARGGVGFGSGNRQGFGGYGGQMDRGGYEEVTYGFEPRQGGGYGRDYDARQGGGYGRDYDARQGGGYGRDYDARQGGGHGREYDARQGGGYGRDYDARQGGGYGRDFGQGRALGGGYGRDYNARPLTDDEFYSRVNRW